MKEKYLVTVVDMRGRVIWREVEAFDKGHAKNLVQLELPYDIDVYKIGVEEIK